MITSNFAYARKTNVGDKDYPLRNKFRQTESSSKYCKAISELLKNCNKVYNEKSKMSKKGIIRNVMKQSRRYKEYWQTSKVEIYAKRSEKHRPPTNYKKTRKMFLIK